MGKIVLSNLIKDYIYKLKQGTNRIFKCYQGTNLVWQEDLYWETKNAHYVSHADDTLNSSDTGIYEIKVSHDGTKVYVVYGAQYHRVDQYNVSTPWNFATMSYEKQDLIDGTAILFNADETKMCSANDIHSVDCYNLRTAKDITSRVFTVHINFTEFNDFIDHMLFGDAGSKLYVCYVDTSTTGSSNYKMLQYNLSTPYSLSSKTYVGAVNLTVMLRSDLLGEGNNRIGLCPEFSDDGTKLFLKVHLGVINSAYAWGIVEYSLSSPWNISSAYYDGKYKAFSYQTALHFVAYSNVYKSDGSEFFMFGRDSSQSANQIRAHKISFID